MEASQKTSRASWSLLRAGGNEPSGISIPTRVSDIASGDGAIRFALGSRGQARLLLPLGAGDRKGSLASAPALDVRVSDYVEAGQPRRFLDLTCLESDLEKVFAEVTDQILSRIATGEKCLSAARSTIEEFRALLVRPTTTEISQTRIAGLVGELLVLQRLLNRSADAWRSWRGPAMDRHDFARGSNALEVKVSMGKGRSNITINGLEQLTEPAGGNLFLQHLELEASASAMLSVGSLGRAVIERASRPDQLRALLAAVGCTDINDPEWNSLAFRLEGEALYAVTDGFPRLVSTSFPGRKAPAGVSRVSYSVDLSGAGEFKIEASQLSAIEGMFVP